MPTYTWRPMTGQDADRLAGTPNDDPTRAAVRVRPGAAGFPTGYRGGATRVTRVEPYAQRTGPEYVHIRATLHGQSQEVPMDPAELQVPVELHGPGEQPPPAKKTTTARKRAGRKPARNAPAKKAGKKAPRTAAAPKSTPLAIILAADPAGKWTVTAKSGARAVLGAKGITVTAGAALQVADLLGDSRLVAAARRVVSTHREAAEREAEIAQMQLNLARAALAEYDPPK